MLPRWDRPLRFATLLMMAVTLLISAGRVVHAHADGESPHSLPATGHCSLCRISAIVWHAHVHVFGIDVHIPVGDEDDFDSHQVPGDLSPSWSDQPSVADAAPLATPELGVALDCACQWRPPVVAPVHETATGPPHSGLSPGRLQRILLTSLTL
jgi:hypothetical protein